MRYYPFLLCLWLLGGGAFMAQPAERPNVILILADDLGRGDLAHVNGGLNRTPALDRLATESLVFEQAYAAAPVCAPSRAGLLTGRYPHETGCVSLGMRRFPALTRIYRHLPTMADVFATNGYVTGMVGKWHSGLGAGYHPLDRGFQTFEGFMEHTMVPDYFDYELEIQGERRAFTDRYLTDELNARARQFVRRHRDTSFFLHLAHYAPHRPLGAPDSLVRTYEAQGYDQETATVYAMIEIMDRGIGELLATLDSLGLREKTLVIFSSDNGPDPLVAARPNQGLRGSKYTVYEGGIHVPFLLSWPGGLAPGSSDALLHFTDVLPTLIDLCGLEWEAADPWSGRSLAGLWHADQPMPPPALYWQWNRGVPFYSHNAAMREGPWKLVRPYQTRNVPEAPAEEKPRLYNLETDPGETQDVSEAHWRQYQDMLVRLEAWSRKVEFRRMEGAE